MEYVKTSGTRWNNMKKRASNPKDLKDQAETNKAILHYIRILQEEIDELREMLEDDGR